MNVLFRLRRAQLLLGMKNQRIFSEEDYLAFMEKSAGEYTAEHRVMMDETAKANADCTALFCRIDAHRSLIQQFDFPFSSARSDQENALAIMQYLTLHTFYCGATRNLLPDDGALILQNSFDRSFEGALNCRAKAIALTDVLNACGMKAFPVCAISENNGCHFLVQVWIREENRFIVMDPSFNCTFSDASGRLLSVHALRDCIMQNETVTIHGYSFLGTDAYKDYYYSAFICDTMVNLSTWKTNKRSKKDLSKVCGVPFNANVPYTL